MQRGCRPGPRGGRLGGVRLVSGRRRTEAIDRTETEPFGRRSVLQDQLAHGPLRIGAGDRLRSGVRPGLVTQGHLARGIGIEVARPVGLRAPRRDQNAAIGVLDVAEGDLDRAPAYATACLEAEHLPPAGELLAELVRQRPRPCQLLPSVWIAGA